jgi:hypothetical protein
MTSPILLGNTQILRHGMGAYGGNVQTGWSGTFGVGFTNLFVATPTIAHPDGGVLYGRACFDCYSGNPGSIIEGCVQIDGGGLVGYGKFYFNNPNGGAAAFSQFCFSWNSTPWGRLAAGVHTVNIGVYCEGGTVTFDANCGGSQLTEEVPS